MTEVYLTLRQLLAHCKVFEYMHFVS